jgi:putative ABC transport system permease protein
MRFGLRPGVRRLLRLSPRTRAAAWRDVDDELDALIANRVEHLVGRGMSPDEARAEAVRRLGASLDDARHQLHTSAEYRERRMRFTEFLESVMQDLHYAARGLIRRPAFTTVAVLTLAIGVGATTAIYSAVNVLLLRPLPYARPDELMKLSLTAPARGVEPRREGMVWSYPKYTVFRDAQHVFSDLAVYSSEQVTLTSGDVERIPAEYVSATYLRLLGLAPSRGRDFDPSIDAHPGAPKQTIISYALWQRRYNADPSIVGRTIDIDRQVWTIIGVGPRDFHGLSGQADVLLPVTTQSADELLQPQSHWLWLVGRRAPGVTESQAASATAALGLRVSEAVPDKYGNGTPWGAGAAPLNAARIAPAVKRSLLVLFGAVGLVLLIACVNVANLLLGRASARSREMAVRIAIGAGRSRLVRLLLTESLLLAFFGAVASLAVAWAGVKALSTVDPSTTLRAVRDNAVGAVAFTAISLDWNALAFALVVSLIVGVLFGLAPALGTAGDSVTGALKGDRVVRGAAGTGRRALVVAEVALALVLLAGSGLMIRSLANLLSIDTGFDSNNVLTFRLTLPPGTMSRDSMPGFYSQILNRVRAVPGVTDAALDNCAPSGGWCNRTGLRRFDVPGSDIIHSPLIGVDWVTPNWSSVMRIPLKRGRMFDGTERADGPKVVVLNETAARTFFGSSDPIGKHIELGQGGMEDAEVIGIVRDVRQQPDSAPGSVAYVSYVQSPRAGMIVFAKTARDPASLGAEVRRAVHDVAPQLPVYDMRTMTERTAAATAQARFRAVLFALFAITALALAAVGIYGVMSLAVTARTREMGIRIALGAERARVQRLVIGEGIGLVTVGAVIGLAGALAATRVLRTFLFDLTSSDPVTYVAIVVVLGGAAILASWIPARRASRVDPVVALRAE